ncbi:hypothetical protein AB205_0078350 [Aquarana catesbeiana]|uniref:Uncharacterized protein n=1 Tax=Aquarana catesbeiana TaxID=8400 RepID=A0A2G9RVA3_AQUCT|nr:hypothetical protein AB205_0078350 [Aquarana catesbeiana]
MPCKTHGRYLGSHPSFISLPCLPRVWPRSPLLWSPSLQLPGEMSPADSRLGSDSEAKCLINTRCTHQPLKKRVELAKRIGLEMYHVYLYYEYFVILYHYGYV